MEIPTDDMGALEVEILHVTASQYLFIAGACVLVYDHILTFSDEVEYIWKQKLSTVSIMFLANRYITPLAVALDLYDKGGRASVISHSFCFNWYYLETVWNILSFVVIHALVAMRVHAIWGKPRWLSVTLPILFFVYFASASVITLKFTIDAAPSVRFEPTIHVCFATLSPHVWTCWIPALLFESFLFVLTMLKAVEYSKKNIGTPVLYVLYRDGVIYFIVVCLCGAFNLLVWLLAPPSLAALPKYFLLAIIPAMGARLVLNLKGSHRRCLLSTSLTAASGNEYELNALAAKSPERHMHGAGSQKQKTDVGRTPLTPDDHGAREPEEPGWIENKPSFLHIV
ncbi:hypothetical protein FRC08_003128 [Ceratobasidium sp. 394]|nr:hypothetical protein FRC08_003128 [Ceratobasidium sp. 394]KAG9099063.1 hypothetical protein FS749_002199 [Ceratobasidium sp. UAMH 11750]